MFSVSGVQRLGQVLGHGEGEALGCARLTIKIGAELEQAPDNSITLNRPRRRWQEMFTWPLGQFRSAAPSIEAVWQTRRGPFPGPCAWPRRCSGSAASLRAG